jgi:hypothetical protein
MTKFSFEVPIKHLQDFEDLQDFHFTLSMLYDKSEYWRFYLKQKAKGDKAIWLDNSWNEKGEPADATNLIDIYSDLLPDKVISPDSPEWPPIAILESFESLADHIPRAQLVAVTNNLKTYQLLKPYAKTRAIAYRVRPTISSSSLFRMMPMHFLGLNSIQEIREFKPFTCDTSMPIKLAMRGYSINDWVSKGCPHIHTRDLGPGGMNFFNAKLTKDQIKQARINITTLKEMVK